MAWNSLYQQGYQPGGSFLPSWGVHGVGQDLTNKLLLLKGSILELGCGDGQSVPHILSKKPEKYVGLDFSEIAIKNARLKFRNKCASFIQSDFSEILPFEDNSFDEVVSVYGIGWSNNVKKTLSEVYRILKPGGTFTFSWDHYLSRVVDHTDDKVFFRNSYNEEVPTVRYNWNQTGYNIKTLQAKPSTWISLVQDLGFIITRFYELDTDTKEEKNHSFSASYDLVNIKMVPSTIIIQVKK